jgi:hypothetical protein
MGKQPTMRYINAVYKTDSKAFPLGKTINTCREKVNVTIQYVPSIT